MIKSMTGFGRGEASDGDRKITIEMKSVNHRYFEPSIKMPKKLNFYEAGIRTELDDRSESMNYKIREALQQHKVPYVCVVGDKEKETTSVAVRQRGVGQIGTFSVDDFVTKILDEIKTKA